MRLATSLALIIAGTAAAADGNRFAYLDDLDPYYPYRTFPKLITPQWVGEPGVDAVIILAIDDMRGHQKWETYLRPILDRLTKLYGTAPVSIMTCKIEPDDPHLQKWLKEGLSLECHTIDHPCPILSKGDFPAAKSTYDRCVDLLASVPNNKPVAFRTPCCDSLNTVSPRLFAEIINKTTAKGNYLQADSSVFNVFTPNDPDLKREWVTEGDGRARFAKYLPADRDFVNTIEDYPYPYPIGTCWEFPCATPSDWQAQHLHKAKNELTVRDWYACLDCTVKKQGVMNLVFHPHGWIENTQVIQLIDYAYATYGKRVKFLTFREAVERINKNLLAEHPLRDRKTGGQNGVCLLDVNGDGYQDVVIGTADVKKCRVWDPEKRYWTETAFPCRVADSRFGVLRGRPAVIATGQPGVKAWQFIDGEWKPSLSAGLPDELGAFRLLDLNGNGTCEIISDRGNAVYSADDQPGTWCRQRYSLPTGAKFDDFRSRDRGVRFVDLDGDGQLDVVFSNDDGYGAYLFESLKNGWVKELVAGPRSDPNALPPIAVKGTNNGAFVRNRRIYWQNENTDKLPDLIDRRSFNDLLAAVEPGPKTPEQSLKLIAVRPGYRVELAAAEPLVMDPIAVAWAPDGKLWVVEMGDYPLGTDGKGKPGGRVRFLESTKGDGRYDKSTVFLENIGYPTGVLPWRKGVLVTSAPDLVYAEDTDGDGKADKVTKLFTGFAQGNQQHRVNGLVWGLDNWVYCANGDSGGTVKSLLTGKSVDIRGRDFRIRPDTGEIELTSGQAQYSKTRDDWGNWFGGNNSQPAWHVVLDDRHLARNPHSAAGDPLQRLTPGPVPVFPTSRTLPRFNDPGGANRFTSACGLGFYRDDLFEPALRRDIFVCEPVHNLVHRMELVPDGPTFTGRRAADESRSEFLSSADNWFRPTMARTGPDGALWVVDMYRAVIEHPQWIPVETQKKLDLRAGHDMGRLYRVSRVGAEHRPIPRLDKLDTAGLVAALDSPNGWQRDMAQMMLLWRADDAATEPLEKLARTSKNPLARLHALATLDGLGVVRGEVIKIALADEHTGVVAHALRVCERHFADDPELGPAAIKLTDRPALRLQLAAVLGAWDDPRAGAALGKLLREAGDHFVIAAGLSSLTPKNFPDLAAAVLEQTDGKPAPPAVLDGLLSFAVAGSDSATLAKLLAAVATPKDGKFSTAQLESLVALLDGLARRKTSLAALAKAGGPEITATVARTDAAFAQARKTAADPKATAADRLAAIRLLGRGPADTAAGRALLADLLGPQSSADVQAAAVAALARSDRADTPAVLFKPWKGYTPAVRAAVLAALLDRDPWVVTVLDALERKDVLPAEVDAAARQRLLAHATSAVRERAGKLLAGGIDADRAKVIEAYRPALTAAGDRERGKAVFVKSCAACHKVGDVGKGLGPDLAALSDKSAEYLLVNILDPNRAVEARYVSYLASTTDGRTRVGFLSAETATGITLVATDGQEHTILRTDLEALASSGKSVMPEGLEKDVTVEQMTDLLTFLRASLPPARAKTFPGNKPEVIKPDAKGDLRLPATAAEIYGPSLVFEAQYKNLGYWMSADDRAVWTVTVPKAGRYEVWFDWACPKEEAGKAATVGAGGETLTVRIEATAGWDEYKQGKVGELKLPAGDVRLTVRGAPPLKGALMDLRTVRLVPAK